MSRREKRQAAPPPSEYKYRGYEAEGGGRVAPHEECEMNGNHRVRPPFWPPRSTGAVSNGDPSMALVCELCGCWVITYEKHGTGEIEGVDVIIPEKPARRTPVTADKAERS
jgi:hypothetical protein